ncbi:MAG: hypothetical protein LC772_06550 [Chloroflexi bacterium]|nr:hypothetical protein [Chloroflexota bacterium]
MDEAGAAARFLHGQLTQPVQTGLAAVATQLKGLVGDRIVESTAPAGTTYPVLVLSVLSTLDRSAQGDVRVWSAPLFLVKAIAAEESYGTASLIYGLADQLIQGQAGYVSSQGQVFWVARCNREQQIQYSEEKELQRFAHVGGKYRMLVQPSPAAVPAGLVYPY